MPELPEVETVVRRLRAPLLGHTFSGMRVEWERMIHPSALEMRKLLVGQSVEAIDRRGKYLVFELSGQDDLIIHLKMTGDLQVMPSSVPDHPHDRVVFCLENGDQLRFRDPRKFGRVYLTQDPALILGQLGPEPLDNGFTEDEFLALFERRSGRIKPLLMNQEFIAGLGNIYADEALFLAGIRPQRRADTLSGDEKRRLYRAILQVLWRAIEQKGTSLTDKTYRGGQYQQQFLVYGRLEQPCLMCERPIQRIRLGQRSAHFCLNCQR